MIDFLEIFSLVTGLVYMVAQIFQWKWMWYADMLTAGAALAVAVASHIWGNAAINAYFFVMAFIGIVRWRRLEARTPEGETHLVKVPGRIYAISAALLLAGGAVICLILFRTNDPHPIADGISLILSIIGCWWLTASYLPQWYLWIASDLITAWIFASQGLWWMAVLYICYVISAVFGIIYWKKHGKYIG